MKTVLMVLLLAVPGTAAADLAPAPLVAPAASDAAARQEVASLPRATAVNDADGDKVFDDLEGLLAARGGGATDVIVTFRRGVSTDEGVAQTLRVAPRANIARRFGIIPAFAGTMTAPEIARVARLGVVRQIERDAPGAPELETATAVMGADVAVDQLGVTGSTDGDVAAFTARDVTIAILDTGFHENHLDLYGGKILAFTDVTGVCAQACDPGGHGTHVASIAAGLGRVNLAMRGVAPGSPIYGIKIEGGGSVASNAIRGFELAVERAEDLGVRVVTMSFGFGTATDGTSAMELAVDAAWDAGLVAFKSAGNSGPGRGTITIPGAARGIIATGSILDHGGGGTPASYGLGMSAFSSRGPTTDGRIKPDLIAPGESITAARAGSATGYTTLSGTSMASPFAAGTAALVIAANPSLSPDSVRQVMITTAEDWGTPGPDIDHGWGRIQVREAVIAALGLAGAPIPASTPPVAPRHETRVGAGPVLEGTFEVTDTAFPVNVTATAAAAVFAVDVFRVDGPGPIVGGSVDSTGSRSYRFSFLPAAPGTYGFRILAAPGALVADISHSTAP